MKNVGTLLMKYDSERHDPAIIFIQPAASGKQTNRRERVEELNGQHFQVAKKCEPSPFDSTNKPRDARRAIRRPARSSRESSARTPAARPECD